MGQGEVAGVHWVDINVDFEWSKKISIPIKTARAISTLVGMVSSCSQEPGPRLRVTIPRHRRSSSPTSRHREHVLRADTRSR